MPVRKGYRQTDEHRARIAAAKRKLYEDPHERELQRQRMLVRSHGMVRTGAYNSWYAMKQRVLNPRNKSYYLYGGRGITIDPRWVADFTAFHRDMGDRPDGKTLDRIDNDGNYEPGNCQWSTHSEQARNRRKPGTAKQ